MLRRLTPLIGVVLVVSLASPAEALIPPDTRCTKGRVAITFDDGPSKAHTPRLLKILRRHDAQATFFVQGQFVKRHPGIVRAAVRDGHAVGVHSWDHPQLTKRSKRNVTRQLKLTKHEIRRATGQTPVLYRPPFGSTSKKIRAIGRKLQLREELWTIDTRDWDGRRAGRIKKAALKHLRPHRSNVILMHDAVRNSRATLKAVPAIIKGLRKKGYCLVPMQHMMPLGVVSSSPVVISEGIADTTVVPITLRLDGPAQRHGTVSVRAVGGSAVEGTDFQALSRTVKVPRGTRKVTVELLIHPNRVTGATRQLALNISSSRGLRVSTPTVPVIIADMSHWTTPESTVPQFQSRFRLVP